jgi:hypothetical protein
MAGRIQLILLISEFLRHIGKFEENPGGWVRR